jgi:phosphatidylserine decarboxylase
MAGDLLDNRGRGNAEWGWPPIHPEGRKFGLAAVGVSLIVIFLLHWSVIGWPLLFASIVSPADGLVTLIQQVPPPAELQLADGPGAGLAADPLTRISIFMSVFDVHINRAPIGGTVSRVVYIPGKFVNADLDKASDENERQHILIDRADGVRVAFTQIAGLVARRIVPFVKPGDIIAPGQRVGLIRFGSRVDVYLPHGTESKVLLGQKVIAGETVLAEIGRQGLIEGVSQ